jgi:hypothetical protein
MSRYHRFIAPVYPILSHNTTRLRSRLDGCPPILREALYESLNAAVRSFPSPNSAHSEQQNCRRATQLTQAFMTEIGSSSRSLAVNLVYLQAMFFLAIEAENRTAGPARGQVGPSQSVWLGSAIGLAYDLKLHLNNQSDRDDLDTDDSLGRKIWWSLVIMDRWRSVSMASPVLIPESAVVMHRDDLALLGGSVYQLARKSFCCLLDI